ncbi:hypothetical protein [Brytella acorum]|uniref:Uncharacterized protein n=1 Tax=Brytella acorum TaxID=2959299 RepID=A0AA35UYK3_9PROT|nr:hypothetical protein [Brytella acorum]CAI9121969.1 hypothetical protein LMG32879_002825 [Brytella acorum]
METVLSDQETVAQPHDTVLECVEKTEKIKAFVPLALVVLCVAPPVLGNLIHFRLGSALVNGVVCFLIAGLLIKGVNGFVLAPF